MFTDALPGNRLPITLAFGWRELHRKHSSPSIVAFIRVYKAVAWQRVYQIRYRVKPVLNGISRDQKFFSAEARFPFNQGIL
jgi:hypothetical protein